MKSIAIAALISLGMLTACSTTNPTDAVVAKSDTPVANDGTDRTVLQSKAKKKANDDKKSQATAVSWTETYGKLLKKYVASNGVRYAAWKSNPQDLADLQSVVDAIAAAPSSDANLAFYLNAYNAWILHQILEDYPTNGPGGGNALGRAAFFAGKNIEVSGRKLSFNNLENDIIRKQFSEPRIHFALNCASASCPPLMNKPFDQSYLDADLTRLTRTFVNNNPEGFRKAGTNTYSHSEIFDWFSEDFGNVRDFINKYRNEKIAGDAKLESHDYAWTLNSAS